MPKRKHNIEHDIQQFEGFERMKSTMKCGANDEYFTMETEDPIEAQIEAWKRNRKKGWCDHIDIQEVRRYHKDPKIIYVKFRCCRIRK